MTVRAPVAGPIFLVSTATLSFEVLLVRAFAIEYLHHFAFLAIGVAMLGIGASGVLTAVAPGVSPATAGRWLGSACAATTLALLGGPALVDHIALDPTQLLWDSAQWWRIGAVYLMLAIPFGIGSWVVLLALIARPEHTGRIYGTSFLGGGAGGLVALAATAFMFPDRALAVPAVLAALASGWCVLAGSAGKASTGLAAAAACTAAVGVIHPFWRVDVSPQHAMPAVEALPDAERLVSRPGPAGWVAAVHSPAFRHAPGLSLGYRGTVPSYTALLLDGDLIGAVPTGPVTDTFYDWLPTALPYATGSRGRVLLLGYGSLAEVPSALAHGADHVVAVLPLADVAALAQELQGNRPTDRRVEVRSGDVRSAVASPDGRFDVVMLPPTGTPGGGVGGLLALDEDYTHTLDAYTAYLGVTAPDGVLAVTSWLAVPPRASVRVILTVAAAMRAAGSDPATGMLVLRSWGTVTVVAQRRALTAEQIAATRAWARARQFDVDFHPGITAPPSGFHELDEPIPYLAAQAAATGDAAAQAFAKEYAFDVAPVTDAAPYPRHFLRFGGMGQVLRSGVGTTLPFAELGLVAVLAALVQSVVLSVILLIVPVTLHRRSRGKARVSLLVYFAGIGLAYLAVEIAAIRHLTLLLGQPTYALTAVLATFLVCSGVGSVWSERRAPEEAGRITTILAVVIVAYAVALLPVVHAALRTPFALRAVLAFALVAPPAFLMGTPFPIGLRRFARADPARKAWAWAANGFASVVASPLAALVSVEWGSRALLLLGAVGYAVAALAKPGQPPDASASQLDAIATGA